MREEARKKLEDRELEQINPTWQAYSFGPFEFFPQRQLLLREGSAVRVGGRALDLLRCLVVSAGEVVTKQELISRVWPGLVVDEANLKVNMSALRRALGEGSDSVEYIATVTGRGYRFVSPVRSGGDHPPPSAPARSDQASRNNLAIATTRILGRAEAIESISLDVYRSRLVSIVGPGGVGKTTVAIAIAERFLGKFRDGVWFVDLAAVKDPTLLPNAIAIAVGGGGQLPNSVDALCDFMKGREILLVLDSCEHLVEAVAACANRMLATAGSLKLLVTSREALMLSGERVRRLPGLAIPPPSAELAASEALKFSAIQLFVERATESYEAFELSNEDAAVVADICRRLDGLALAIELAATRIEAFGVRGLHKQLNDSSLALTQGRSGPERHRTLTATIEWSYGLLPAGEARVLRAVSAFAASFNAEGAAAVADVSTGDATRSLTQLAAKSFLSIDIDEDKIAYRLLETTRAFCRERLRLDSSHSEIVQRHARYICELLNQATSEWAQRPSQKLAANYDRALTDLYKAICTSTMVSQGLMFQAMDAMRRAVEIASDIGDVDSQLRSLRILGVYELFTGEPRLALRTFEQFSSVVSLHEPELLTESDAYLAVTELFLGRLESSRTRLEKVYEDEPRRRPPSRNRTEGLADAHWVLPHPRWLTGAADGASQLALATIARVKDSGEHTVLKNNVLAYAVPVFYWCGHFDDCRRYASELKAHSEEYGFYPRRPIATLYRGALGCLEPDRGENILAMQSSIEELRIANHLARMPYHLCLLAEALTRQSRHEEADAVVNASIDSIRAQGEEWCLPEVLRIRAGIFSCREDDDGAEAVLLVAMQKARDIGARAWELRAANDLASLWMRKSRLQDAHAMLEPIHAQFTEGHGTRDLMNAARLLHESSAVGQ